MNRIDRLTGILFLLQGGKSTATEIAEHFEVSKRTILRDIQALCEIGIPITAELGTTGGYTLPPDYYLPSLALTFHETLLLHLALSSIAQLSEIPFRQERASLLAKVRTLLPHRVSQEVELLQQKLSFHVPAQQLPTPFLDHLLESARTEQWVNATYDSENGVSQQLLLPMQVISVDGLWYLEAYSYESKEIQMYRVDRMLAVQHIPAPEERGFAASLPPISTSVPEVHLRLTPRGVFFLQSDRILGACVQVERDGGGWLRERLPLHKYDLLVRTIMSLGVDVEVLAPESLRTRVQQETQNIAQHFSER